VGTIESKNYMCSLDITQQYGYFEVSASPEITQACLDAFEIFLVEEIPFPQFRERTQADAQIRAYEILAQFPFGFAVPSLRNFSCGNGTFIPYWIVESQI
jgi:hypothetical protein